MASPRPAAISTVASTARTGSAASSPGWARRPPRGPRTPSSKPRWPLAAEQPVIGGAAPAEGDRGWGAVEPAFPDLDEDEVAGDHQGEGEEEQAGQRLEAQGVGER